MALHREWEGALEGTDNFYSSSLNNIYSLQNSPMARLITKLLSLGLILFLFVIPVQAARDTNSYDGNIFPIYAGNGSLVPPPSSLSNSLENKRTSVLSFYLDDSATSKAFAPVVSGLKLLWGTSIDLTPVTTDQFQTLNTNDPKNEAYYWHGNIPQVVVIDLSLIHI